MPQIFMNQHHVYNFQAAALKIGGVGGGDQTPTHNNILTHHAILCFDRKGDFLTNHVILYFMRGGGSIYHGMIF